MRIAIGHFHLRAGGVTRVIEMTVRQLIEDGHTVAVVVGEEPGEGCRVPRERVRVVGAMSYGAGAADGVGLGAEMIRAAAEVLGGEPDVFHLHNHALGKNASLPVAVVELAAFGMPLLLQLHDFAENGRPANRAMLLRELGGEEGLARVLYPQGARVQVAVLTEGDRRRFGRAGGDAVVLGNPVSIPDSEAFDFGAHGVRRPLVYPTRAIRRKNLGEALLWALIERDRTVVISAHPENPADAARLQDWMALAERLGVSLIFDAQRRWRVPCEALVRGADACLSTSIAEGFGMAFLEPWAVGVPVLGRDLPDVTSDFAGRGVKLEGMYRRMDFPVDWVGLATVRELVARWVGEVCDAEESEGRRARFREIALSRAVHDGRVDFGCLDEALQREVVVRVARDAACVREFSPPRLAEPDHAFVAENQSTVIREFHPSVYANELESIYTRIVSPPAGEVRFVSARNVFTAMHPFDRFSALLA